MAVQRIEGVLDIDLPPGGRVERAVVRLEDVTMADVPSTVIASRELRLIDRRSEARFLLEVDAARLTDAARYLLSARADVRTDRGELRPYGTTQAYPWPAASTGTRLVLKPL